MTPEQFLKLAQVLPEPLLFITGEGEILATNRPAATMLERSSKEIVGKMLFDFVVESPEQVIKYLQSCSKSRQMVFSSLTLRNHDGETLICRCEGAVIQPKSKESPALNLLRLKKRTLASSNFILLNQKIQELTNEILQRRRAEEKLSNINVALQQTLHELQQTQLQLIQTEKMSSLGQLVAGIAHEINNPISFIEGNLFYATKYLHNLLELVQMYQNDYPNPNPGIQNKIEAIDLSFIQEDLNNLLNSMRVGTERISEIVKSLRNFSRLDESEVKNVDIHSGIDSTLVILQHRLKAKNNCPPIEVIREYGQLPLISCYPSQLNQVFMNILSNGIDALDEYNQQRTLEEIKNNPSKIWIRTEIIDNNWIAIRITDNGPGMTEKVRQQIFDPFFTTKPVGKGTGLGLSISYQIVNKHGGLLHCVSEVGLGTEFIIEIPRNR